MKAAKRAESSTPAWPMTRLCGKPVIFWHSVTIASSGFEMTITNALGAVLLDAFGDLRHDLGVDVDQVVTAHARFAGKTGGDDDHVGTLDVLVAVRALELDVEAVDRSRFGDVEHLPLGKALDDVEQDHITEFAQCAELSQHATNLTATN